jgi:hypothetical protein
LHIHHKRPIVKGGSHKLSNLTTVCQSCHEKIHGHPIPAGGVCDKSNKNTNPLFWTPALAEQKQLETAENPFNQFSDSERVWYLSRGNQRAVSYGEYAFELGTKSLLILIGIGVSLIATIDTTTVLANPSEAYLTFVFMLGIIVMVPIFWIPIGVPALLGGLILGGIVTYCLGVYYDG